MKRRLHLIANSKSGSGLGGELSELALRICAEMETECVVHDRGELEERAKAAIAAATKADVVVAAGGDGTIRTVAELISGTGIPFGVVPCGTFNFFARVHRIPEDREQALRLSLGGKVRAVRLGEINGRKFLINASLGLYAKSIEEREVATARFGRKRIVVVLSTIATLLKPHRLLTVRMKTAESQETRSTPMIFIGNNSLQLRNLKLSVAKCFRDDMLAVVTLKPVRGWEMLRVIWRGINRTLEKEERLAQACTDSLVIETRRAIQTVALDGEMFEMRSPFRVSPVTDAILLVVPE